MACTNPTRNTILHKDSEGHNKHPIKNETAREDKSKYRDDHKYIYMINPQDMHKYQEEHKYQNQEVHKFQEVRECNNVHDYQTHVFPDPRSTNNGQHGVPENNPKKTVEASAEEETVYEVLFIKNPSAKFVDKTKPENPKPQNSDRSHEEKEPKSHENNEATTPHCNIPQKGNEVSTPFRNIPQKGNEVSTPFCNIPQKGNGYTQSVETRVPSDGEKNIMSMEPQLRLFVNTVEDQDAAMATQNQEGAYDMHTEIADDLNPIQPHPSIYRDLCLLCDDKKLEDSMLPTSTQCTDGME